MNMITTSRVLVTAGAAAALIVPSSLAAGEPKNVRPFTSAAGVERAPALAVSVDRTAAAHPIVGEPKNERPFTLPGSEDPGLAAALAKVDELTAGSGEGDTDAASSTNAAWISAILAPLVGLGVWLASSGRRGMPAGS